MKESASELSAGEKTKFGIGRDLDISDMHVEVTDLLANRVEAEDAAARAGDHSAKQV